MVPCMPTNTCSKTLHFYALASQDLEKIYAIDVTDRNVTLSRTVKIQGSVHATILHLKGLVYYGGYHVTC